MTTETTAIDRDVSEPSGLLSTVSRLTAAAAAVFVPASSAGAMVQPPHPHNAQIEFSERMSSIDQFAPVTISSIVTGGVEQLRSVALATSDAATERPPVSRPSQPVQYGPVQDTNLVIADRDRALLSNRERLVVDGFLDVLEGEARRLFVQVPRVEITRFKDPEDNTITIVIAQHVALPVRPALEYWEMIGPALTRWTKAQPSYLQQIAIRRVSVDIRWHVEA